MTDSKAREAAFNAGRDEFWKGQTTWDDFHGEDWEAPLRRFLAAYIAALWQPIESAPKDGTPILVCSNGHVDKVAWKWINTPNTIGWWRGQIRHEFSAWSDFGDARPIVEDPTHWQPLPTPPAETPTSQR